MSEDPDHDDTARSAEASGPPLEQVRHLDSESLRGIAHPLRMKLLGALRLDGPATATQLAAAVGESSGTVSWHLRVLAEHDFISEDTERGNKRERWWKAVHEYTRLDAAQFAGHPADLTEVQQLEMQILELNHRRAERYVLSMQDWDADWLQVGSTSDLHLRLTAERAMRMRRELSDVVQRYKDTPSEDGETVELQLVLFPRSEGNL